MSKKIFIFLLSIIPVFGLISCSETDDTVSEFDDWQNRNETYFNDIYTKAIADPTDQLDTIRKFSLNPYASATQGDFIVVQKIENSESTSGSPQFTDEVKISYRGRYIPTTNYKDGYVFDQTYQGDFNWESVHTIETTFSSFVTGFSTALQKMRIGDRWRVYIPYQLGYGESGSDAILGYSTLIFDISLHAFKRPDAGSVNTRAIADDSDTPRGVWITK